MGVSRLPMLCYVTSVVSDSVWPHRWRPTRLPHPWDSPGKNTGVGCHFLLWLEFQPFFHWCGLGSVPGQGIEIHKLYGVAKKRVWKIKETWWRVDATESWRPHRSVSERKSRWPQCVRRETVRVKGVSGTALLSPIVPLSAVLVYLYSEFSYLKSKILMY